MRTKLCPSCKAEYFDYVRECIDCLVELVSSEEIAREESEKESFLASSGGEVSVVREGDRSWLKECRYYLSSKGIESYLSMPAGCSPGSCGTSVMLVVSKDNLEDADNLLYGYYIERHPDAAENACENGEEVCPACGCHAGAGTAECPDCGLVLVFD